MNRKITTTIAAVLTGAFLLMGASSCEDAAEPSNARKEGQALTQKAYDQQSKAVPYPADEMRDSLERRNLDERLLRQNDPKRVGYVYFFPFGSDTALGYWTIKGKVSSTQSQMTPSDEVINWDCGAECGSSLTAEAPGDDGSFGENEKGVFFFTTEDAMIQVCESCYVYSDQPVALADLELNNK